MKRFNSPDYNLGFVTFTISSSVNSETGLSPYTATFSDRDASYFQLPDVSTNSTSNSKEYVKRLSKSWS